jgi:hypothetical protein
MMVQKQVILPTQVVIQERNAGKTSINLLTMEMNLNLKIQKWLSTTGTVKIMNMTLSNTKL